MGAGMTDRVLTPDEVQKIISRCRTIPEHFAVLIISHRLLHQRVEKLEAQLKEWEEGRHD